MQPVLVTPPSALPVTLAEARSHCRVAHDGDDTYITTLIGAAVGFLDGRAGVLGRAIKQQAWSFRFCAWPVKASLPIDLCDVSGVVVKYFDAEGVEQTVSSSLYHLEPTPAGAMVWFRSGFTAPAVDDDRPFPISVTATAGMVETAPGFQAIRHAILLLVGHWYENREAVVVGSGVDVRNLPMAVDALIAPYRRVGV